MYRCLLVPLDGTVFGEEALPFAVSIARRSSALLRLAHVHLPPILPSGIETAVLPVMWIETTRDEKRAYLADLSSRLSARHDVRVTTCMREGEVASALAQEAADCSAGLIVMTTHAHVGVRRLWHNGVADQLGRDSSLPVLLIRHDDPALLSDPPAAGERDIRRILVPLDGSREAEAAIPHAVRLGRVFGARFTLFRVVQPQSMLAHSLLAQDMMPAHQLIEKEEAEALGYLEEVAAGLRREGLEVETELATAQDVAQAILERIRRGGPDPTADVDLVAIRESDRGSVTRLLFRGVVDTLVRETPVPVLVLRSVPMRERTRVVEAGLAMG